MIKTLIIPIHIEGCLLEYPQTISPALGDFSKLQWCDEVGDINFENAYLSEEIIHHPFHNDSSTLQAGFHLHWILPSFLGTEYEDEMASAPNRWIVSKVVDGLTKNWLIESDYVHASTIVDERYSVFPVLKSGQKPFRAIGQVFELNADWTIKEYKESDEEFDELFGYGLTVLGYGDMKFSASYPACKSIFGFHDAEITAGAEYSILGWHNKKEKDPVASFLTKHPTSSLKDIAAEFHLDIKENSENIGQALTFYFGELCFDKKEKINQNSDAIKVAIGNTATEAYSALLASDYPSIDDKIKLEDQLEYVLLNSKMDGLLLDHLPKFLENRHQKGFTTEKSGTVYSFALNILGKTDESPGISLPEDVFHVLNELNELKTFISELENELSSLNSQLYTDWYKYMRASYPPLGTRDDFPDTDLLKHYIKNSCFQNIEDKKKEIKSKKEELEEGSNKLSASILGAETGFIDNTILFLTEKLKQLNANGILNEKEKAKKKADLVTLIERIKKDKVFLKKDGLLTEKPNTPFWKPNNPVVAISNIASDQRPRTIACFMSSLDDTKDELVQVADLLGRLKVTTWNELDADTNEWKEVVRFTNAYSEQEWNPFILEWAVQIADAPLNVNRNTYKEESFEERYYLDADSPRIFKKELSSSIFDNSFFQGSTYLTPFVKDLFLAKLDDYIEHHEEGGNLTFVNTIKEIRATLSTANILSQSLGGFNEACLMLHNVPQLPIKEPLRFIHDISKKGFTEMVNNYCTEVAKYSPLAQFDFNPIRNGKLIIDKLRVVNNFGLGQQLDISSDNIISADTLTADKDNSSHQEIFLPPRIVQPSRLNFNFLAANSINGIEDEELEMGEHPITTPICGWLVPNYLDESIMIFSNIGEALGSIKKEDKDGSIISVLEGLPWEKDSKKIDNIENVYLKKVVNELEEDGGFLNDFLSAIQNAQNNIAPASFAEKSALSLLMGKPIAVTRVNLSFQLKGFKALNQSWTSIMHDAVYFQHKPLEMSHENRYSGNWTNIKLPLRLGEYKQLNDGLLGYWVEEGKGLSENFYAPETTEDNSDKIVSHSELLKTHYVHSLKPDGEALSFTLLMDPRGLLHATTGVLPTKSLSIPSEFYTAAIENMCMWFKTSPVLQFADKMQLNLPELAEYSWKWYSTEDGFSELEVFDNNKLWNKLPQIKEGWLLLERQENK